MIDAIFIPTGLANYGVQGHTEGPLVLPHLSKVNLFVGPNNSGKSRFLRSLSRIEKVVYYPKPGPISVKSLRDELVETINNKFAELRLIDVDNVLAASKQLNEDTKAIEGEPYLQELFTFITSLTNLRNTRPSNIRARGNVPNARVVANILADIGDDFSRRSEGINRDAVTFEKVYIPTLRGIRTPHQQGFTFEQQAKKDYFDKSIVPQIFAGDTLYDELKRLLLGTLNEREIVANFQDFLSTAFFEGQDVALIPRLNPANLFVKIGVETEQPIHDLGDGIQSIIVLTFPLFRASGKSLLYYIEEPELFMHPGLQRLFLDVICKYKGFERFQYFIATHSNHFLDLTADVDNVSIFTFSKSIDLADSSQKEQEAKIVIENVSNDDQRTLELLGVRSSSVFLSNCTIWVEGITDRRYLSHYLNLFQAARSLERGGNEESILDKKYKEDLHFSFVEYGGGNITHWSFLDTITDPIVVERLCAKLFLITDRDDDESIAKSGRREKLESTLGDRYYCLCCREIENLLTPSIIKKAVDIYERIAVEMPAFVQEDYQAKPLGRYIEDVLLKDKANRRRYSEQSGTLTDKLGFCQKAISELQSFSELSSEAQELTKKLYAFIERMQT